MWLRRRLGTAERGRDQLDRKLRVLIPELQRRRIQETRCSQQWSEACAQARTWLLRAAMLGGQEGLINANPPDLVDVEIRWETAIGVSYPAAAMMVSRPPELPPAPGNAAVVTAAAAFQKALLSGISAAAAQEAVRRIDAEIILTRQRLRALDKRWLPWLRAELAALEVALQQNEQEEGIRLRRAALALTDRRSTE